MIVGMLGDILFEVSDEVVQTINNAQWSGSARYATHQRHLYHAKTEYLGMDPDQMKFDIKLSSYLGVNPQVSLNKIWLYERNGIVLPLVLGFKAYGKYRWAITKHNTKLEFYDGAGNLTHCTVTLSLQEYLYW